MYKNSFLKEGWKRCRWLLLAHLIFSSCLYGQPHIIFDTDMGSDCDDAGALAVLHKLADKGEAKILGVMFSSGKNRYGVGVCDAINTYYGRSNLPLGQYQGNDVGDPNDTYSKDIATHTEIYHHNVVDSAQELVSAYKAILKKQPNASVTLVSVGHPNGLFHLIQDREGRDLVKRKVKKWIAMAYADTMSKRDWNFGKNGAETCIVALLEQWPTPIFISGYGKAVVTGHRQLPHVPDNNPVKQAYRLWKNCLVTGRPSPDQLAVLYAVRPDYFEVVSDGSITQDSAFQTRWNKTKPDKKQHRLVPQLPNIVLEKIIEELMTEPPSFNNNLNSLDSTVTVPHN